MQANTFLGFEVQAGPTAGNQRFNCSIYYKIAKRLKIMLLFKIEYSIFT